MSTLDDWISEAASALGLPADALTADLRTDLLDLTRDAAHNVARIAGPLTTYLVGVAVGRGMPAGTAVGAVAPLAAARAPSSDEYDGVRGDTRPAADGTG